MHFPTKFWNLDAGLLCRFYCHFYVQICCLDVHSWNAEYFFHSLHVELIHDLGNLEGNLVFDSWLVVQLWKRVLFNPISKY